MNSQNSESIEAKIEAFRDACHSGTIEERDATFLPSAESFDSIDQMEESGADNDSHSADKTPIAATIIDQSTITASEKKNNAEFFCGRGSKTPDRYMKIRNFILNAWSANQPKYLSKTSVRSGLKDCGDVNAIGRVHAYLESIGAINVGDDLLKKRQRVVKRKTSDSTGQNASSNGKKKTKKVEDENWTLNGRGRKVHNDDVEWENLNDQEFPGNDDVSGDGPIRRNTSLKIRVHYFFNPNQYDVLAYDMVGSYDPFRLVPPLNYTSRNPAPFRVSVSENVMLVMDFHAHLAYTEIIGLLGGHFYPDRESMEVTYVYPCKSASTGFQCEMDPASEVAAREEMWRREDGLEPFIGVIVTPYDVEHESNISRFQFWMSGSNYDLSGQFKSYRADDNITKLDKMMESLSSRISASSSAAEAFLLRIKELVDNNFLPNKKDNVAERHDDIDSMVAGENE
ncbi:13545_t:CDS:10 [Acaulospora colombiana]|uniref:13545_t:CDS:1 n=1 Tax=Acaulospora colombiana TaxID=27376 RepID=A0ACA9MPX8_9GLOM|nr:13545_t:CDS:10 [Acaulospora colombiana]